MHSLPRNLLELLAVTDEFIVCRVQNWHKKCVLELIQQTMMTSYVTYVTFKFHLHD
jgi:hypothetical protein